MRGSRASASNGAEAVGLFGSCTRKTVRTTPLSPGSPPRLPVPRRAEVGAKDLDFVRVNQVRKHQEAAFLVLRDLPTREFHRCVPHYISSGGASCRSCCSCATQGGV